MELDQHAPVGMFDSGIGGLSVAQAVRKHLPHEHILYVADSAYTPYGDKSHALVQQRASKIANFLVAQGAKAIVVACNTATAMAAEMLRATLTVPVIAMEPAIKPAAKLTRSDVIAVLATAGTLSSDRYADLRDVHGKKIRVLEKRCDAWVRLVEKGQFDSRETRAQIEKDILPLLQQGADTLVLGCTHFPLLAAQVSAVAGADVQVVDPSPAIAIQLQRRLQENGMLATGGAGKLQFFTSAHTPGLDAIIEKITGLPISVQSFQESEEER